MKFQFRVLLVLLTCISGFGVVVFSPSPAVAAGTWSAADYIDSSYNPAFTSMSCSSQTYCLAVDASGTTFTYNGSAWSSGVQIDSEVNGNGNQINSISCILNTTSCVAVDSQGYAVSGTNGLWSAPVLLTGTGAGTPGALSLNSVSCPSQNFCMAVDSNGNAFTYNGSVWSTAVAFDPSTNVKTVSCPSSNLCVVGDVNGDVFTYNGSSFGPGKLVDTSGGNNYSVASISCPVPNFCMAIDQGGNALSFNGSTWTTPTLIVPDYSSLSTISCPSSSFCLATINTSGGSSYFGDVVMYSNGVWSSPQSVDTTGNAVVAGSCPSIAFCIAGDDGNGNVFIYNDLNILPSAPQSVTATPSNASANLSWQAPSSQGACSVSSYQINVYSGTTLVKTVSISALTATVTGLTNGQTYTFTVSAINCDGASVASPASVPIIPSAPTTPYPYNPLSPYRICDSRTPNNLTGTNGQCNGKPITQGMTLTINVSGTNPNGTASGGVPSSGADAVILNVTVTNPTQVSYLTVFPSGTNPPLASNVNFAPGQTVPNLVQVALPSSGMISIYNSLGTTDIIVDVEGYVGSAPSGEGLYNPLPPSRICDTRPNMSMPYSGSTLGSGSTLSIQVDGEGNVPSSGVSAVVLNVTETNATATSYLTVWPDGTSRPLASNLNWVPGQTSPNRVVVPVGSTGMVSIYNSIGSVDVIVDVGGWFSAPGGSGTLITQFSGITPARVLDTRSNSGVPYENSTFASGTVLSVQVGGVGGVPANATAVVLNVTVTNTNSNGGYLTVWPTGQIRNTTSDLNWSSGQTTANLVVVKLGSNGQINLYNYLGSADVIADVIGWYQ